MTPVLHSKILGNGKPLLILHGFLGMLDNWKTLGAKYAENGFEVHLLDQRNHGKSFWSADFNYDILADDLKRYMEHHSLEKAILIGHSMGGKTVMHFACDHPEKTKKIIVADIAPKHYPPHHQDIVNGLSTLDLDQVKSRGEADKNLSKAIPNLGIRQFLLKNLFWKEKGSLGLRLNLDVLRQKMAEIGENIDPTAMYNGPTLFLRGDRSDYISQDDITEIKSHFPNAAIETIENAGHWLHAENPTQFFQKSLLFINR